MDNFDILEWKDSYSVGVETMDEHHKKLIMLIQDLDYSIRHERGKGVNDIMASLINYAGYHFDEEEKLMEKNEYPELQKHKEYHEDFKKKLVDKVVTYESDLSISLDLIKFLNEWLINHILIQDKKYSKYIK